MHKNKISQPIVARITTLPEAMLFALAFSNMKDCDVMEELRERFPDISKGYVEALINEAFAFYMACCNTLVDAGIDDNFHKE